MFHYKHLFYFSHINKNAPPPICHVFQPTQTIFKLVQDIFRMNLLIKLHEDRTINVASRVLTSNICKNAPPPGGHVFQPTCINFKIVQDIIRMILLTKFHEDWRYRKNDPPLGSHVFQANLTIFEIIHDIIETNRFTIAIRKNAPPPGGHVFQPTGIIFNLVQDTIGIKNLLTYHFTKNSPLLGSHVF
ncbi:hypothetical protein DPMN_027657 [Dreissena polymorpha]|uniref:Uncharacterized protein n=1 Tax=Dreissena polymorpha TaxID=45954 RepID=A0A9D4LVK6_DREPO|nr:hypothetical protein DPMN_027657 [Dreissena polymorpha]